MLYSARAIRCGKKMLKPAPPGVGYTPAGELHAMKLGNGLTESIVWEPRLQPCVFELNSLGNQSSVCDATIPSGNVQKFGYVYGVWGSSNNGDVTAWGANGQQAFNRGYTYDKLNRLSAYSMISPPSTDPSGCNGLSWSYDAWGNRKNQTTTGGSCVQPSATFSQTTNRMDGYSYDTAGNLLNDGNHTYTYDAENRIVQVDGSAGYCSTGSGTAATACYVYDADGRRVQKASGGVTTGYLYDTTGKVVTEFTGNNSSWGPSYVYLNGQLLAEYENGSTFFPFADHLGSTRLLTNLSGCVVDSLDYLPFGELYSYSTPCTRVDTTHKFTSKERDSESGLDNFGARYDSSQYGRFMTPDPVGGKPAFPQTWNAYAYVGNNPLNSIDPTGLDCVYLNDQGNGIDSIDNQSSAGECQQTGGAWAPGTITNVAYNPNSNDVLLGYAYGDTGNIQYSQITATPGQFGPGNDLDAVAAGINANNPQGFINAVGSLMPVGGVAAYGGIAVAGTYGWGTITTAGVTTAGTLGPAVQDPKLQTFVNMLFQATDKLPGGTAGAVRSEIRTGELLSDAGHSIKAQEIVNGLQNLVKSGTLSQSDTATAKGLIEDLKGALATSPWIR